MRRPNQTSYEEETRVCCARGGRDGRDGLPGPPGPQGLAGVLGGEGEGGSEGVEGLGGCGGEEKKGGWEERQGRRESSIVWLL